jgi:hypothetical protein
VPFANPELLPVAVRRLDDAGVVITELALRSSSLEEVFLNLTGRPPDDDGAGDHVATEEVATEEVAAEDFAVERGHAA